MRRFVAVGVLAAALSGCGPGDFGGCDGLLDGDGATGSMLALEDALYVGDFARAAFESVPEVLGLGPFLGAVELESGARVFATSDGFVVDDFDDPVLVRPDLGEVHTGWAAQRASVRQGPGELLLVGHPDEVLLVATSLDAGSCGEVADASSIEELEDGVAVRRDDRDAVVLDLDGTELWRVADRQVRWAEVVEGAVLMGFDREVVLHDLADGRELDRLSDARPVDRHDAELVLEMDDGLHLLDVVDGRMEVGPLVLPERVVWSLDDAVRVGDGLVALGRGGELEGVDHSSDRLVTPQAPIGVSLPDGYRGEELHVSGAGHLGLVVSADGVAALLVWGPPGS